MIFCCVFFFFQAEDVIRDYKVTGVQTCALPIWLLGLLPALPIGGPILGLLFGSMLGAFVGEMLHRRDLALPARCKLGAKVSLAIVVSSLIGNVIAGVLSIVATAVFVVTTWSTAMAL